MKEGEMQRSGCVRKGTRETTQRMKIRRRQEDRENSPDKQR